MHIYLFFTLPQVQKWCTPAPSATTPPSDTEIIRTEKNILPNGTTQITEEFQSYTSHLGATTRTNGVIDHTWEPSHPARSNRASQPRTYQESGTTTVEHITPSSDTMRVTNTLLKYESNDNNKDMWKLRLSETTVKSYKVTTAPCPLGLGIWVTITLQTFSSWRYIGANGERKGIDAPSASSITTFIYL